MAAKSTRTTRTSKTKTEVKDEFEEVAAKVRSAEALPVKEAELKAAREATIRKQVEDISPEAITQKVTAVQFAVNRTLASVQEQLVQQTQELDAIKQAKELLQADLERLHSADKVLSALDVLVQEYEDKSQELEAAYAATKKALEEDAIRTRQSWSEEQKLHAKTISERNVELEKTRQREQADFEYNYAQTRKQQTDAFAEEIRVRHAAERDRKEQLDKEWATRSAELTAKENDFVKLKTEVDAFPAKLDSEVKRAEAIVGNTVKREYEHKIQLLSKDAESQQKVLEMQIQSLQDAVQKQQVTIAELQTRLKDSENNVKSIAEKALDSASSTRTLAEVRTMLPHENNQGGRSKA